MTMFDILRDGLGRKDERIRQFLSSGRDLTFESASGALQYAVKSCDSALALEVFSAMRSMAKAKKLRPPADDPELLAASALSPSGTLARVPKKLFLSVAHVLAQRDAEKAILILRAMCEHKHSLEPVDISPVIKALIEGLMWCKAASTSNLLSSLDFLEKYKNTTPREAQTSVRKASWDAALGSLQSMPANELELSSKRVSLDRSGRVVISGSSGSSNGRRVSSHLDVKLSVVRSALSAENVSWLSLQLLRGVTAAAGRQLSKVHKDKGLDESVVTAHFAGREAIGSYELLRRKLEAMRRTPEFRAYIAQRGVPLEDLARAFDRCATVGLQDEGARLVAALLPYVRNDDASAAFHCMHSLIDHGHPQLAIRALQVTQRRSQPTTGGRLPSGLFTALARACAAVPGREALDVAVELAGQQMLGPGGTNGDGGGGAPSSGAYTLLVRLCMDTLWLEAALRRSRSHAAVVNGSHRSGANRVVTWPGDHSHTAIALAEGSMWPQETAIKQRRYADRRNGPAWASEPYEDDADVAVELSYESDSAASGSDEPPESAAVSDVAYEGAARSSGSGSGSDGDGDLDIDPLYRAFTLYDSHAPALRGCPVRCALAINVTFVTRPLVSSEAAQKAWAGHQAANRKSEGDAPSIAPAAAAPLVHVALEALRRVCVTHYLLSRRLPTVDYESGSSPPPSVRASLPAHAAVNAADEGMHADLHAWHLHFSELEHRAQAAAALASAASESNPRRAAAAAEAAARELERARDAIVQRAVALPVAFPGAQACGIALLKAMREAGWAVPHMAAVRRWVAASVPVLDISNGLVDAAMSAGRL